MPQSGTITSLGQFVPGIVQFSQSFIPHWKMKLGRVARGESHDRSALHDACNSVMNYRVSKPAGMVPLNELQRICSSCRNGISVPRQTGRLPVNALSSI